ncbi:MAG TPA: dTMP kinase [Gammaproteobacteria bacterium]|nr:dTMP kinase [Gammaproteobacteria bacterium]
MDSPLKHWAGKFITFEGIEGVGKSTHLKFVAEAFQNADIPVVVTREPGGTEIAEGIRGLLLEHHNEEITPMTELLLMFAARAQHIAKVIRPALQDGKCVVCDRFTDATYAYQGGGRGIYLQHILQLENMVQDELRPDLTILLDATNVDACLARAKGIGTGDRIEIEELSFFERARKIYLARAHSNPSRFRVIDAMQPIAAVQQQIMQALSDVTPS